MPIGQVTEERPREAGLISLDDACRRAIQYCAPIERFERVPLVDAIDRVLAEDIRAKMAMPPFDQSAMDGYAFAAASIKRIGDELLVVARVPAGISASALPVGAAARVFTGSPVSAGADAVVMQERVLRRDVHIALDGLPRPGSNIRRRGEDIGAGESLLRAGKRQGPHHIALQAAQGVAEVRVRRPPRVVIASTGNELRQPGERLIGAAVYDSNRPMLIALARQAGLAVIDGGCIPDELGVILHRLAEFADEADFVVTTGGASVGEADHSSGALKASHAAFEALRMAVKPENRLSSGA